MRAYFVTLARYNVWATRHLLDAIAPLADEDYRRDLGLFFQSIHGTLNHLIGGEHLLWYPRFADGSSPRVDYSQEFERDRLRLAQRLLADAGRWQPLIAHWPVERFSGMLDYTTTRGVAVSLPFAATLAHVFNHGTHHRGQITAALTALGRPAPEIDLVYMLQQEQRRPAQPETPT